MSDKEIIKESLNKVNNNDVIKKGIKTDKKYNSNKKVKIKQKRKHFKRKKKDIFGYKLEILHVYRSIKTVSGDRIMSFIVAIALSPNIGSIGIGIAKGRTFFLAKQKAIYKAKKNIINNIPIVSGSFSFSLKVKFKTLILLIKPRRISGLKCGSVARTIFKMIGYTKLTSKFIKGLDSNKINAIKLVNKSILEYKKIYDNKKQYFELLKEKKIVL